MGGNVVRAVEAAEDLTMVAALDAGDDVASPGVIERKPRFEVSAMVRLNATAVAPTGTASGVTTEPLPVSRPSATETTRSSPAEIRPGDGAADLES